MAREISAADLAARLKAGARLTLVDVRDDWERELVSLPDSLHIPIEQIPARAGELPKTPDRLLVAY